MARAGCRALRLVVGLTGLGLAGPSRELLERIHREFRRSRYWPDVTYRLAQRAAEAKDNQRAGQLAAELLKANTEPRIREYALYMQGQLAAAAEQWDQVRPVLEPLLREFPASTLRLPSEFWLAEATYRQGDYDAAGQRFEHLVQAAKGQQQPWLTMVALRRAQIRAEMHNGTRPKPSPPPSKSPIRISSNSMRPITCWPLPGGPGRFRRRPALVSEGDPLAPRRQDRDGRHGTMDDRRIVFPPEELSGGREGISPPGDFIRLSHAAIRALLQAGKCYELLGQWKEAVELYDRLLKVYPQTTFAEEARRRLSAARGHVKEVPNQP